MSEYILSIIQWQTFPQTIFMFFGFNRCFGYIHFARTCAKHSGRISFWTFSHFESMIHRKGSCAHSIMIQHCSQKWGRSFQIFLFMSVSDHSFLILSILFFPIFAIGFVGGGRGVRLSGFGCFFSEDFIQKARSDFQFHFGIGGSCDFWNIYRKLWCMINAERFHKWFRFWI